MAYPTLAVTVTDAAADAAALDAALGLAQAWDAHLDVTCVGYRPMPVEAMPYGATAVLAETSFAEAEAEAKELLAAVTPKLAGVPRAMAEPVVLPEGGIDVLARRMRYADLAVIARPEPEKRRPLRDVAFDAALFDAGIPVLVVPGKGAVTGAFRHIVVAWDESEASMAAIRAAMPALEAADRVDIVLVDPPSHSPERSDPGGALCTFLARHGVKAEVSILARTMPKISDVLKRFVREKGADLLVMGGYGHSRLREAVLGGVTRDLLDAAEVPLFLAR